jgi:hypothetical protein
MGWTMWKKLATKEKWYPRSLKYQDAACYELGVKGKWKQSVTVTYVGKTGNLRKRMSDYAQTGSHLEKYLRKYWKYGYVLYFRYFPVETETKAARLERERLEKFGLERYPWNTYLGID